jgi:hypothetical protein
MLDIRPELWSHFAPYLTVEANGRISFNAAQPGEYWTARQHFIPTSRLWLTGAEHPQIITDLFIGYSAAELLCFCSRHPAAVAGHPEQLALAATGLVPLAEQVTALAGLFPFARWHLLFGGDLLGRVADTAVALWYKGNPAIFRVTAGQLLIPYQNRVYEFDERRFSLSVFEKTTGLRAGMRTHKPTGGQTSFIKILTPFADDPGTV